VLGRALPVPILCALFHTTVNRVCPSSVTMLYRDNRRGYTALTLVVTV